LPAKSAAAAQPLKIDAVEVVTAYVLANAVRLFAGVAAGEPVDLETARCFLALNERCGARMLTPVNLPSRRVRILRRDLDRRLAPLVASSPLGGDGMPAPLVLDQLKTFLFAGHETTTSSIVSALHLLAAHPECQQRCRDLLPAGREALLRAVYQEALRLYPPAWLLARTARADDPQLGVRRGDHVFLAVREIHRHPDFWSDPDVFRPERHLEGSLAPGQYIPYGAGPKMCVGHRLAPLEAVELLRAVLDRCHLRATGALQMRPHITLFPRGAVELEITDL
jgi:cytochrome P450